MKQNTQIISGKLTKKLLCDILWWVKQNTQIRDQAVPDCTWSCGSSEGTLASTTSEGLCQGAPAALSCRHLARSPDRARCRHRHPCMKYLTIYFFVLDISAAFIISVMFLCLTIICALPCPLRASGTPFLLKPFNHTQHNIFTTSNENLGGGGSTFKIN